MDPSRAVALLVLGSVILAVAGQSAAQVRFVGEQGATHWVGSAEMVPEMYRQGAATPFGARRSDSVKTCNKQDLERNQRRIESDAATAQSIADSQEEIAKIERRHRGVVETSAHLEARLAESRRNALGPLEAKLDMLKQLADCAAEGKLE